MKQVAHVLENWSEMKGRSLIEKKLNAYLTYSFIGTRDVPHDECYKYATQLYHLAKTTPLENRQQVFYTILSESFNQGQSGSGIAVRDLDLDQQVREVTTGVLAILAVEMPKAWLATQD